MRFISLLVVALLCTALPTHGQHELSSPATTGGAEMVLPSFGFKTNLLYDATSTFNLGIEFRTGKKTSIDIPVNWNPWTFKNDKQWRQILVQPELRFWTKETFKGHFLGIHGHWAMYNVGNWSWPFSDYMANHRFEGWLAGAGVSYGYRWNFNHRWAMEATVGVGYAYMDFDKYECGHCGEKIESGVKHYVGPTKIGLNLILGLGGRRAVAPTPVPFVAPIVEPVVEPVVEPFVEPAPPVEEVVVEPYIPHIAASFVTPEPEAVKARQESGSAFLDFASGQSAINPTFRNNAAELSRMHNLIESVTSDPNIKVTGITITGFASPEGSYVTNMTLSERRATALKNHIKSLYTFPESLFTVHGAGEDWATLETLVRESDLRHREQVLSIINSTGLFDGRERQLMSLATGVPYRTMLAEMFPKLRRVEYDINFTVVPFTIEESKEVFRTRPGNLSLNEMFLIANTYAPGSTEFNEVFETAARLFPDSDVANLNAAASALERKDLFSAERYLGRVQERGADYWNNMGVLSWLKEDTDAAKVAFSRAGGAGASNLAELEKHLESIVN